MALEQFAYTPEEGLRDKTAFPDDPGSGDSLRGMLQGLFDQIARAFNTMVTEVSGNGAAAELGASPYADIDAGTVQSFLEGLADKRVIFKTASAKYIRVNSDLQLEISADGVSWQATGSSGHVILDAGGAAAPQRSRMQFVNCTVTDDGQKTIVHGIKGDKGDTGAAGPQGEQGERGERGERGMMWRPAVDAQGVLTYSLSDSETPPGAVSIRGPQGPQGVQGIQGQVGPQGPQGVQGVQGIQGAPGERGPQGPQGIPGPQGPKGDTGAAGPQGETGPQGEQGPRGEQGPAGAGSGDMLAGVYDPAGKAAQVATESELLALPVKKLVGTAEAPIDLNTVTEPGRYYVEGTVVNGPTVNETESLFDGIYGSYMDVGVSHITVNGVEYTLVNRQITDTFNDRWFFSFGKGTDGTAIDYSGWECREMSASEIIEVSEADGELKALGAVDTILMLLENGFLPVARLNNAYYTMRRGTREFGESWFEFGRILNIDGEFFDDNLIVYQAEEGAATEITQSETSITQYVKRDLNEHTNNTQNPHGVTAAQVGAAAEGHTHTEYLPLAGGGTISGNRTGATNGGIVTIINETKDSKALAVQEANSIYSYATIDPDRIYMQDSDHATIAMNVSGSGNGMTSIAFCNGISPNKKTVVMNVQAYSNSIYFRSGNDPTQLKMVAAPTDETDAVNKQYVDSAIAAIPAPDVSGQISTHNTDTAAHADIRTAVAGKADTGHTHTPASIGAAAEAHNHDGVYAPMYTISQTDITAGSTPLASGTLYLVYE